MVGNCNKNYQEYKNVSNGYLCWVCMEHYEVFGGHIMVEPESVDDYFSSIIMMVDEQTDNIELLSDNSCQIHRYGMHREPSIFKKMTCYNDTMHGNSHVCGPYYNVKYLKKFNPKYSGLNDSKIEQINSKLDKLKHCSLWMNLSTFTKYVVNLLEIENRNAIRKRQRLPVF